MGAVTSSERESADTVFVKDQLGKYSTEDVKCVFREACTMLMDGRLQCQRKKGDSPFTTPGVCWDAVMPCPHPL